MKTAQILSLALALIRRRRTLEEERAHQGPEFWPVLWAINRAPMLAAVAELRACPAPRGRFAAEHAELVEYSAASAERFISLCDA